MPRDRDDRDEYGEPRKTKGGNAGLLVVGCLVVGVLVLSGGGYAVWYFAVRETTGAVIARYRPQFAGQRAKLKRVAALLPPAGTVRDDVLPADLAPKPVYDVRRQEFNVAFLMEAHCVDPDRDLRKAEEFDLTFFEDGFLHQLQWTGDKNPMAPGVERDSAGDLAQKFERSLVLPYLVIVRPVRYVPPRVVNDRNFIGGELELEVFVLDYRAEKVVGSFRRSFTPVERVQAEAKNARELAERAEAMVRSEAWGKARTEIVATLARGTGGTFVTDR